MAHVWTLDASANWSPTPLRGDVCALATSAAPRLLLRRLADPLNTWALLCSRPDDLRINGLPAPLGLTVLADRDEIRLPSFTGWFSTETQACVEPLPESVKRGFCPRCKQAVPIGSPAVRCPGCGLWHHASDDLPCWTYAPTCAGCSQDTALDADFRWTPEDL